MAWTITRDKTVFGNKAVVGITIQPDSATFNVETGLKNIHYFAVGIVSATTISSWHIAKNSGCVGTALAGTLGCTGFTSGDLIDVIVFGTR